VLSVGRLDINTEGLLLLTNDGGLARVLELPSTGWLRRYRVRAFGKITQAELDGLADGVAIDGVLYGAIEATLDKEQGDNVWLTIGLREGKNREVKRVLEHLGMSVNRLIRVSFGPFQLADLEEGRVREIRGRVLRDQLGEKLIEEAGADFDAPILNQATPVDAPKKGPAKKGAGRTAPKSGGQAKKTGDGHWLTARAGAEARDRKKPFKRQGTDHRSADTHDRKPAARRIWGEDGLIEDKRQDQRGEKQGKDGRPGPSDRDSRRPPRGRS